MLRHDFTFLLLHSVLCYLSNHIGEFAVETKNAGIGTILIRVHGIRDAFKIEAAPKSESDQRTLIAQYHPRIPGEYVIFVRWSGVHVPGSPFTVKIKQKPGEEPLIGEQLLTLIHTNSIVHFGNCHVQCFVTSIGGRKQL